MDDFLLEDEEVIAQVTAISDTTYRAIACKISLRGSDDVMNQLVGGCSVMTNCPPLGCPVLA
jgi:hypothetical protein